MSPTATNDHPHIAVNDLHAVCEIIYDCYVSNRKRGMSDDLSKRKALSKHRLQELAKFLGEPDPYTLTYPTRSNNASSVPRDGRE